MVVVVGVGKGIGLLEEFRLQVVSETAGTRAWKGEIDEREE